MTIGGISADGLFSNTDLKPGMQVMSINNVPIEDLGKFQAIDIIKDAVGKVVVVGAPPSSKPKPAAGSGVVPPPGVAAGGIWGKNKYVGDQTTMLMLFGCLCFGIPGLCVYFCPQDDRDAYRLGDEVSDRVCNIIIIN